MVEVNAQINKSIQLFFFMDTTKINSHSVMLANLVCSNIWIDMDARLSSIPRISHPDMPLADLACHVGMPHQTN